MGINSALRGAIYSKFKNIMDMAEHMNMPDQKLRRILKSPEKQSLETIYQLMQALGISDIEEALNIFLPNRTKNNSK